MKRPFAASWKNYPLRTILRSVSEQQQVAVLLDRRIDPTTIIGVELNADSLRTALSRIAERVEAQVSPTTNVAYMGPASATSRLRTLIQLRTDEMMANAEHWPQQRVFELVRRRDVRWNDLDEPREILRLLADRYGLALAGLDAVPHDLWAAAEMPAASVTEAFSSVLIQFDLTFSWVSDGTGVKIVPIPKTVELQRTYLPGKLSPNTAVSKWKREFPNLNIQSADDGVLLRGTLEDHELLEAYLNPRRQPTIKRPQQSMPLSRRRFTLTLRSAPAGALFAQLKQQGIQLRYDERQLKDRGIDLNQRISVSVDKATAAEFFRAVCKPLGLDFRIEKDVITLTAKDTKSVD